ncbi:MAG: helix-turn-helix transcriptional regulator [Acetobacteraceae bacterium]
MREEVAAAYVGLSASGLRGEVTRGRLAKPVQLTPGRVVYLREDLDAYLDRQAGRTPTYGPDGREWMEA